MKNADERAPTIVATLKHGKVLEKKYIVFFGSSLVFILTCVAVILTTVLIVYLTDIGEEKIPTLDFAAIIVSCTVLAGFIGGLLGYLQIPLFFYI